MEIQFLGATKTVTGSKYLLKGDKNILVDCGLFQGLKELRLRNWDALPFSPAKLDAVILTHAHLDHSGYLPVLVKSGFRGKIYGSELTIDLTKILLLDSGHLQEEEANRANKHGYSKHKPAKPLYTRAEAEAIFPQMHSVDFHSDFNVGNLHCQLSHAGHILGASCVTVKSDTTSILFTGDLGRSVDPCVLRPEIVNGADYLVVESTYGDRLHENIDPKESLAAVIERVAKRGGVIIIPAFAVGRTQTLLYDIYRLKKEGKISNIPIFLDSPMAEDVTDILLKHPEEHMISKESCHEMSKMVRYINSVEESKQLDAYQYPRVIISASGMATGGRVLHHIKALGGDARNVILFAGYQAAGTRGAYLLQGNKQVKIYGEYVTVNAEVLALSSMSAHADYQEMLTWLGQIKHTPRRVFVTHGEATAAAALCDKIKAAFNWQCTVPEYLQTEKL